MIFSGISIAGTTLRDFSADAESYLSSPEYKTLILWSPGVKFSNETLAVPLTTGTTVSTPSTLTVKLPVASSGNVIEISSSSLKSISSGISMSGCTSIVLSFEAALYLSSPE